APPQRGSARMGARPSGSWRASTVLRPRIGTMNHAESPSPALRAPSPPLGERDGVRGVRFMEKSAASPVRLADETATSTLLPSSFQLLPASARTSAQFPGLK